MEGLGSIVAQNLTVTFKPAASVKVSSILNRYRQEAHGQAVEVALGDLYATEDRQLAVELSVKAGAETGPVTLGALSYRGQAVVDGAIREVSGEIPIVGQLRHGGGGRGRQRQPRRHRPDEPPAHRPGEG